MRDHVLSHTPQHQLAHKAWLGLLLLISFWSLSSLAAAAANTPAVQQPTSTRTSFTIDACACAQDIYEPNDTRAQATSLAVNSPAQSHTFHVESDVDWFRLNGLTANRRFTVATSNLVDGADSHFILYDQEGNLVKSNDDIDFTRCPTEPQFCASTISWTATSSGPYFLIVRALSYPPQEYPSCPCPAYDIRLHTLGVYLPMVDRSLSPTATPVPTPTVTPTATPTQPVELPTTVPLGQYPNGVAVNPDTHRVYVSSRNNDRLYMLDGLNHTVISSAKVGDQPWGVAVNRRTNKVYVANFTSGNLFVLDGVTLTALEILWVGPNPTYVEIDENTNTVFTITYGNESLVVINGNTDEIMRSIGTGARGSWGLALNPNLNRIYISGRDSGTIVSLDGNNDWRPISGQSIRAGGASPCTPYELAFNPGNNKLYAACAHGGVDTALVYHATMDGLTLIGRLAIGAGGADGGGGVVVNTSTHNTFFTNSLDNTVSVVSGAANAVIATVPVGSNPFGVGVDPNTGRVFVGNRGSNNVSVFQDPATP